MYKIHTLLVKAIKSTAPFLLILAILGSTLSLNACSAVSNRPTLVFSPNNPVALQVAVTNQQITTPKTVVHRGLTVRQ